MPSVVMHPNMKEIWFLAPTQALTQMWFRKKYKIHIEIGYVDDILNYFFKITNLKINEEQESINFYETHTETFEAGLLKICEIVKNKEI